MPAIKSSSKTGTKLEVFASERRTLQKAQEVLDWISDHYTGDLELNETAGDAAKGIQQVLQGIATAAPVTAIT